MCGIAGIIAFENQNFRVSRENIKSMLELIAHRGPDGSGVYISRDNKIGLGHVRLGLVDLQGGYQPMFSYNQKVVIVYNGEMYDYEIYRGKLKNDGFKFVTNSDTEIIINLYLKYGDKFVDHLDGEFAFCLYDIYKNKIFLVRDFFGTKPLYYCIFNGTLTFCSEIKGIYGNTSIKRIMNFDVVTEQLFRIDNGRESIFDGINILPPGHMLIIENNTIREQIYWDIDYPQSNIEFGNDGSSLEESVYAVREKLEAAIKRRMVADVEIGCFLSGGLDSSVVAAIMQKYSDNKIKNFSISFEDPIYDESSFAHEVSNCIGSDFHKLIITSKDIVNYFPITNFHCEHTVQQPDGVGKYLLSKYASRFVKSVLVGEGADEVLFGYPWFKTLKLLDYHSEVAQGQLLNIVEQRETTSMGLDLTISDIDVEVRRKLERKLGYYPASWDNVHEMKKLFINLLSKEYKNIALNTDFSRSYYKDLNPDKLKGRNLLQQNAYEFFKKTFHVYLMQYLGGKSEMANSLESRLPFLDKNLFCLCKDISTKQHLFGLKEKNLLKLAFKDILPKNIVDRTKHGYSSPILTPFFENNPDYFRYYLDKKTVMNMGYFNYKEVERILELCRNQNLKGQTKTLLERSIIFVLSVHILHDSFISNYPDGSLARSMIGD